MHFTATGLAEVIVSKMTEADEHLYRGNLAACAEWMATAALRCPKAWCGNTIRIAVITHCLCQMPRATRPEASRLTPDQGDADPRHSGRESNHFFTEPRTALYVARGMIALRIKHFSAPILLVRCLD